jgi:hypothetical protein
VFFIGLALNNYGMSKLEEGRPLNWTLALGGVGLMAAGPSLGHVYAGEHGHALRMTALRVGGLVALGAGVSFAMCESETDVTCPGDGPILLLLGAGVGTYVGATLYDFYDAHRAARRSNTRARSALTVAPSAVSSVAGPVPALGLSGTF